MKSGVIIQLVDIEKCYDTEILRANIARGLESQFSGSIDEIEYGSVCMQPLACQDDISRLASDVKSTRAGSIKISLKMNQRGLKCHPTKTVCIAIGTEKYRNKVVKEVEADPIKFGNFTVLFKESEVYLGYVLSPQGMEKSVELTRNRRLTKVKAAMYETKAIIEDFQMQAIGGMAGAWDIWERAILPSLLANCGS